MDDDLAMKFATYEDFLDSKIEDDDLYYLEDEEVARNLIELGYRGSGAIVGRQEFLIRKMEIEASVQMNTSHSSECLQRFVMNSATLRNDQLMLKLFERAIDNRCGKLKTVIVMQITNNKGHEILGYIDYAHRLESENFRLYFTGQRKLKPLPSDLCYHNKTLNKKCIKPSSNFKVTFNSNSSGVVLECFFSNRIIQLDNVVSTNGFVHKIIIPEQNKVKCKLYDIY